MSQPRSIRLFTACLFLVFLGLIAVLSLKTPAPNWTTLAVFCVLFVVSEQIDTVFASEQAANVSGSIIFAAGAAVAFESNHAYLGPALVGASAVIYLAQWQEHQWTKVIFNGCNFGLAVLAMASVYWLFPSSIFDSLVGAALAAIFAAVAFYSVNIGLFAIVVVLSKAGHARGVFETLRPYFFEGLPFVLLGVFLGKLYLEFGMLVTMFFVVPIFIARATFASYIHLKNSQEATLRTLISALESKDRYTAGHADRVAKYAEYVGEEFSFSPRRMERLRFAALMHDIGKLIVPNRILNKPGRLTRDEYAEMKRHEEVSVHMLDRIDFLRPIAPSVTDHNQFGENEKDAIEPYIVAAADAYDAMTSTRSYRKALPQAKVFKELRDKSGTQFHPKVVEALIHAIEKRGEKHGAGYETDIEHPDAPEEGLGSAGLGTFAPDKSPDESEGEPPPEVPEVHGRLNGKDDADVLPFHRKQAS